MGDGTLELYIFSLKYFMRGGNYTVALVNEAD